MTITGLLLEFSAARPAVSSISEVNAGLAAYGSRVWPLDLTAVPDDIRQLLAQPRLTGPEADRIKGQFVLPRERLLRIIAEAGRTPHIGDGGAMATWVENHGYGYPALYVAEGALDYARFDRFHVNTADDGTGVDEIGQLLFGGGLRILQRRSARGVAALHLNCPSESCGWIVTYDGGCSHIGSLSAATPGTKFLMQAIGPERWVMRYDDEHEY
jgi:hypothetical protein